MKYISLKILSPPLTNHGKISNLCKFSFTLSTSRSMSPFLGVFSFPLMLWEESSIVLSRLDIDDKSWFSDISKDLNDEKIYLVKGQQQKKLFINYEPFWQFAKSKISISISKNSALSLHYQISVIYFAAWLVLFFFDTLCHFSWPSIEIDKPMAVTIFLAKDGDIYININT